MTYEKRKEELKRLNSMWEYYEEKGIAGDSEKADELGGDLILWDDLEYITHYSLKYGGSIEPTETVAEYFKRVNLRGSDFIYSIDCAIENVGLCMAEDFNKEFLKDEEKRLKEELPIVKEIEEEFYSLIKIGRERELTTDDFKIGFLKKVNGLKTYSKKITLDLSVEEILKIVRERAFYIFKEKYIDYLQIKRDIEEKGIDWERDAYDYLG